jgi:hypothetical protein
MKGVFTLLSINCGTTMYLNSSSILIDEILNQTSFDIIVTTNDVNFFSDKLNERVLIRGINDNNLIFSYNNGFNYNLKYLCFEDIPEIYDYIIYLDCDIKLDGWNEKSTNLIDFHLQNHEVIGTRFEAILKNEYQHYLDGIGHTFSHKINSYEISKYDLNDDIFESRLPSEHFLIIKNDPQKITLFVNKWKQMNFYLQSKNGNGGSHCDAFEIGISLRSAGLNDIYNMSYGVSTIDLGFKFNGNKNG